MKRVFIAIALVVFSAQAFAEKLALGSMDMQPCAKTESATVRKGQQRATLFLEISAPNFQRVQDELRHCAEHGVAAATLPALLKNLAGAAPAFWEEFQVCTRYTEWVSADLSVETFCRY
jgi:hypothetical protein